jgi:hypothetical protein
VGAVLVVRQVVSEEMVVTFPSGVWRWREQRRPAGLAETFGAGRFSAWMARVLGPGVR